MTTESDAIVIDQHLSRWDYFRLLMLMTLRKWYVLLVFLAGIMILILGVSSDVYPGLCIFIFVFIVGYGPVAGLIHIFDKRNRGAFLPARLTFSNAEIAVESEESTGTLGWDTYSNWKKIGHFYILVIEGHSSHFIPGSGLSKQEQEKFEGLLRSKIKDHR